MEKPLPEAVRGLSGHADLAQLVEHLIRNEGVGGSNPSIGTTFLSSTDPVCRSRMAILDAGVMVARWPC